MVSYAVRDAWQLHARGQFLRAVQVSQMLLERDPDNASLLACRAMSQFARRDPSLPVLPDIERAVALDPGNGAWRHDLGIVLASLGRLDEAAAAFRLALEISPLNGQAFYALSQNARLAENDPALTAMRTAMDAGKLADEQVPFACYGLARAYDGLGRADDAMRFAREANRREARPYDIEADEQRLTRLKTLIAEGGFDAGTGGSDSAAPVFIVGMPRSGTTLVESILGRHPEVHAAGELPLLAQIEARLGQELGPDKAGQGPDAGLMAVNPALFGRWAAEVLEAVEKRAGAPLVRYTDKLPHNAVRLGLIAKLFPKAKIIHVRRHPLDTGLSNFFIRFSHGHGYANYPDLIGREFRIIAESVLAWRQVLGPRIVEVRYEDLVSDSEMTIRALLDQVGLGFDPACLHPEQGERSVQTASQYQVRQPISAGRVEHWRRYERFLDPMIAGLGGMDWIDAYQRG